MRWVFLVAGVTGATGVGMGAGAAHGFSAFLPPESVAWIRTAVDYQIWHALLLAAIAAAGRTVDGLRWSAFIVLLGIVLFSGSLYVLAFSGWKAIASVTPFGGLLLIAGWLIFAWTGFRAAVAHTSEPS